MKSSTLLLHLLAATLSLLPSVHAHGLVYNLFIDGKQYQGNVPDGNSNIPSPIREVSMQDPIYGATNPDVNCGNGAPNAAALVVDAMPGSMLSWDWRTESLGKWPHDTGPMLTYMASCGNTTCDQFDSKTAKWFKIDQVGQDGNGGWVQKQIMNGGLYNHTLPNNLAPGQYLVRHEIIALHLATTKGKAEFYPSCQQINVGGNGTGVPSPDELLSFPGAYSDDDPGIYAPGVYDPGFQYTFPGGPIASFVTSSDGGNDNGTSTSISPSSTRKPASSTSVMSPAVPTGTGNPDSNGPSSCSLKKRSLLKRSNNVRLGPTRPHRVSRVMGKLLHRNSW